MNRGDLVQKRWGKIEPYQQGTLGIVTDTIVSTDSNPGFAGHWIVEHYPGSGQRPWRYRPGEFEVVAERA